MAVPWLATREQVKRALDSAETARNNTRIDAALRAATASVNRLCRRPNGLHPTLATRYFPWPDPQSTSPSWRLWLDGDTIISATSLISGEVTLETGDYLLEPVNTGPPYTSLQINLGTTGAFTVGDTWQRSIAMTGLFGYRNDEEPGGALAEDLTDSETEIDVTNSAVVGVGDLIRVDSERMVVTEKTMADTGVNIDAADSLTASAADVSITLSGSSGAPVVGEIILVDAERMLVVDRAGLTCVVKRAYDGSTLATHAASADIYAARTLTVTRGACGTTAATHSSGTLISRWQPPALGYELAVAEAMVTLGQQAGGYARTIASGPAERPGPGGGIEDLRCRVKAALGRKLLMGAV